MKLIYRILIHLSLALPIILAAWGILFYMAIIDEVNDEVDDSLEDYSEVLITRALAGEQLPSDDRKARLTGSYSELDASPLFFASPAYSFGEYLGLLPEYASPLCATQMDGPIYDR